MDIAHEALQLLEKEGHTGATTGATPGGRPYLAHTDRDTTKTRPILGKWARLINHSPDLYADWPKRDGYDTHEPFLLITRARPARRIMHLAKQAARTTRSNPIDVAITAADGYPLTIGRDGNADNSVYFLAHAKNERGDLMMSQIAALLEESPDWEANPGPDGLMVFYQGADWPKPTRTRELVELLQPMENRIYVDDEHGYGIKDARHAAASDVFEVRGPVHAKTPDRVHRVTAPLIGSTRWDVRQHDGGATIHAT